MESNPHRIKRLSTTLPAWLSDELERLAQKKAIGLNEYVRDLLKQHVTDLEKNEDNQ